MLQVRCGHIKAEPNNLAKNDAKFVKNMQPQKKKRRKNEVLCDTLLSSQRCPHCGEKQMKLFWVQTIWLTCTSEHNLFDKHAAPGHILAHATE